MKSARGILCPRCKGNNSEVIDVRKCHGHIRRRHRCNQEECQRVITTRRIAGKDLPVKGVRWTTYEITPRQTPPGVPRGTHTTSCMCHKAWED